jgi:acetyl esterase/lipase
MKPTPTATRPPVDTRGMISFICAYNKIFAEAKLEHRGPQGMGFLSQAERDLAEDAYVAGLTPEAFAQQIMAARNAPSIVALPGGSHASFGAVVKAMREQAKCAACGKTSLVFNVSAIPLERRGRGTTFRPERVSLETHCACVGGPAHHLLSQAVAS